MHTHCSGSDKVIGYLLCFPSYEAAAVAITNLSIRYWLFWTTTFLFYLPTLAGNSDGDFSRQKRAKGMTSVLTSWPGLWSAELSKHCLPFTLKLQMSQSILFSVKS